MNEEKIKEAFARTKQDILNLFSQLELLKQELKEIKQVLNTPSSRQTDQQTDTSTHNQTQHTQNTAFQHINTAKEDTSTHISTDNLPIKALKDPNLNISIGNEGVSTDRQTDQQTDTSTGNKGVKVRFNKETIIKDDKIDHIQKIAELINSLDDIKKDLRFKLKRITKQEMVVFATIYQLEEEGFIVDYSLLSKKLNLSESSIRDYIQRITKKGIPLTKTKENNKKVLISISPELKKIASLNILLNLREL